MSQVEENEVSPLYTMQACNHVPLLTVNVEVDDHSVHGVPWRSIQDYVPPSIRSYLQGALARQQARKEQCEALYLLR